MPKALLNAQTIKTLPIPVAGQQDFWDSTLPSFGVRVSQGGSKTFILKRQNTRITIGRYHPDILPLGKAREEAKRLLAEFTLGKVRPQSITYTQAVTLFIEDKKRSRREGTISEYQRLLDRFKFKCQLSEVTTQDIERKLQRLHNTPSEYNHALTALKIFLNWCVKRRYISESPAAPLSKGKSTPRARVLSDEELQCIWRACEHSGGVHTKLQPCPPSPARKQEKGSEPSRYAASPTLPANFARIVQLLILTGQRRNEIASLQTSWLNLRDKIITLPASITKNGREHSFPLSKEATYILKSLSPSGSPKYETLLFPARGKPGSSFNGWSKSKKALDKLSGVKDWTLHDLRRTFATKLAALDTPPHVIERLLNHVSGQISGVAAVYNRHHFLPAMQEAVSKYEEHLLKLFRPLA